jgi:hypothetical protein
MRMTIGQKHKKRVKYRIGLITFGDGNLHWKQASRRVAKNAMNTGYFTKAKFFGLNDLKHVLSSNDMHFCGTERGYGYWLWKPAALLLFARKNKNLDLIMYVDSGTILNLNEQTHNVFNEYLEMAHNNGLFAFTTNHLEKNWTKRDLLLMFPDEYGESNQFLATNVIGKPAKIIELCTRWLEIGRLENYHYIDDSPSNSANSLGFIEHRHDQSILSLLLKERQIVGPDQSETFFSDWMREGSSFPIWNMRHVGSTSILNHSFINWCLRKIDRLESCYDRARINLIKFYKNNKRNS